MHSAIAHPPDEWYPTCPQAITAHWPTSPTYILSMTSYGMEYPFSHFGLAVLAVSPNSFPCTWQTSMRSWEVLDYLAKTENISILSTLFWSQIQNTALHQLPGRKW